MTGRSSDICAPAIVVEHVDSIIILRLNRPRERNSLSIQTLKELDEIVSSLADRRNVSALIVTGTDDAFASGADIRELANLTTTTALDFARLGQSVFDKIAKSRQRTIAAINGYCMGGGLDLALACDERVAASNAVFAHPGARLGIITGWGGTQRLPRLIGTGRALELFATARRVSSEEAYEIGLVSRIGDPVLECALEIAR